MYDVIIVGGGPSGSAAGRTAGQSGLKTLLIDKEVFPRNKQCGGALSERALSSLGFEIPDTVREKEIFGMRVRFAGRCTVRTKEYRIATIVTRRHFDNCLLEKARETGIDIHTGEKAVDFREKTDHVEIITDDACYRSRYVIITEGALGKLKNRIRRRDTNRAYGISMVADVEADNREIAEVTADILLRKCGRNHLKEYERRCYREFGRNFKHALLASRIMNRFPRIFFNIITGHEDALDRFLEVPNLKRQYLSYLGWIIPRIPKLIINRK